MIIEAVDDENQLIIPMRFEHLGIFFGRMAKDRDDKTVRAASSLTGYSSAIKFLYDEKGVELDKEAKDFMRRFSSGYKRIVADKKDKGIMKQYEGKTTTTDSSVYYK